MWLVGRGNDHILSWTQTETLGHFPQVDVGLGASFRRVGDEEVLGQVLLVSMHLETTNEGKKNTKPKTEDFTRGHKVRIELEIWEITVSSLLTSFGTCKKPKERRL